MLPATRGWPSLLYIDQICRCDSTFDTCSMSSPKILDPRPICELKQRSAIAWGIYPLHSDGNMKGVGVAMTLYRGRRHADTSPSSRGLMRTRLQED